MPHEAFTRREFLHGGLTLASSALFVPSFIQRSALGLPHAMPGASSIPGVPEDRILVVVQLSGGNDGLNTVVPFSFPEYYRARPGIGVPEAQVLKLSKAQGVGLHPQMTPLKDLYEDGLAAIIQGVGYPNPNRSHFASMDIWHTADTSGTGEGWLGRFFDSECCGFGSGESGTAPPGTPGDPLATSPINQDASTPGVAIGRSAPLAMQGHKVKPVSFETPDLFRWTGKDVSEALEAPYEEITRRGVVDGVDPNSNAAFLMRTALDAQISSDTIRKAVALRPLVEYPGNELARQLAMVSAMIRAGMRTRVYYVSLGGFDTHAGQGGAQGRHGQLLQQFSASVKAFYADLKAHGNDGRVLALAFSEFGRRVGQNASQGTDHGTAAPVFLFGPMVKPGVYGDHPSLADLDQGDLKYQIDFRSVYAGILENWLKADPDKILEGRFRPVTIFRKA